MLFCNQLLVKDCLVPFELLQRHFSRFAVHINDIRRIQLFPETWYLLARKCLSSSDPAYLAYVISSNFKAKNPVLVYVTLRQFGYFVTNN